MDWELRLEDAMSGPAARAAAALKPVEDKLRDVNRQLQSSAIDKMNDGLEKQRAQLRLQRSEMAAGLRAARNHERAESQMDRAASRARAVAAREERVRSREAQSQAAAETRAKAAADRYFQRSAQQRQRVDAQVRARQARGLAASARQEQAVQRATAREQGRAWSALQQQQGGALEGQRGEVRGVLPGQAGAIMAIATAALTAAAAVAALGAAFTLAVISAVAFREAALGSLQQVLKSAGQARQVYSVGINLAAKWNIDPRETVTQLQDLVSKGFSARDARVLLTASADLKVMNPNANIAGIMLAIGQIRSKGILQMEELQGQLAEAGINVGKVLEAIGKKTGRTVAQVRKDISAGKVDSNTGIWAVVKSIEEMAGGKLGSAADRASKSISSMIMGLQFRPGLLALKMAEMLEGGPGENALRGALARLLKAADPEKSPGMKRLLDGASSLANELLQMLFGPLASAEGGKGLQVVLDRAAVVMELLAAGVRSARPLVQGFLSGFGEGARIVLDVLLALGKSLGLGKDLSSAAGAAKMFGKALAIIMGVVIGLVAALFAVSGQVLAFVHVMMAAPALILSYIMTLPGQLLAAGVAMGTNLWSGFAQGIEAGVAAVTDAGSRLADAAKSAVATSLDQHSPSRVMMEMGGYTAEGFAQGVAGGQGQVDTVMTGLVAPPRPVLGAGGGVTTNTMTAGGFTIQVNVGGADGANAKTIASEVRTAVSEVMEDLLAQMGLSPEPGT